MKLHLSTILGALALLTHFIPITAAYLPYISTLMERAESTRSTTTNTTTATSSASQLFNPVARRYKRRQAEDAFEKLDYQHLNFTPGPIPAAYLVRPRAECANGVLGGGGTDRGGKKSGARKTIDLSARKDGAAIQMLMLLLVALFL